MAQARSAGSPPPALPVALIFWAALGVALNVGIARFTYGVTLPSLRRDLGLDYLGGGALNAVHLAGYLLGTLSAPFAGRRIGMPKLLTIAHVVVASGAILCAIATEATWGLILIAVGRFATGIGAGAGIVAIFVIAFAAIAAAQRPLVSAIVWSGMNAAIVASGTAVSFLLENPVGWRAGFATAAAIAVLIAFCFPAKAGTTASPMPEASGISRFRVADLLTGRWFFLVGTYFMFGVAYIAYSTFAGAKLAADNMPLVVVGAMWIMLGVAATAGAALTVVALNRARTKRLALLAALTLGAAGAFVSWFDSAAAAIGGALLVGLGFAATPIIVTALARDRSNERDYASAFSYATAMMGIGQLSGPVAAGSLADLFGTAAVPVFAAVAYGLGAAFAVIDGTVSRDR